MATGTLESQASVVVRHVPARAPRPRLEPVATWPIDLSGVVLALVCVAHCLLAPVALAAVSSPGMQWLLGSGPHRLAAPVLVILAAAALAPGWQRHRRLAPLVFAMVGGVMFFIAAFAAELGWTTRDGLSTLAIAGGSLVAFGHLLNACCTLGCSRRTSRRA
jgi:hypothetical protein